MEVRFDDASLDLLETDPTYTGGYGQATVKAFRKRLNFIRQAQDERDFYAMRSLNFERLRGERDHQYSMRLNDHWRLILEFEGKGPQKVVVIKGIEDYH